MENSAYLEEVSSESSVVVFVANLKLEIIAKGWP
jgi:hypothetical protein